ncbi:hypothetical protein TWF730_007765 [Orbilia blumenaviensis]|uniref:Uncharacterized protein n=1 Tax=Orbilia blumenaviensis TaxID=1796055 RepID=A0AAV9VC12_9PEZI
MYETVQQHCNEHASRFNPGWWDSHEWGNRRGDHGELAYRRLPLHHSTLAAHVPEDKGLAGSTDRVLSGNLVPEDQPKPEELEAKDEAAEEPAPVEAAKTE